MQKARMSWIMGLAVALFLVSAAMAGMVTAATHTVFAEFGTATW